MLVAPALLSVGQDNGDLESYVKIFKPVLSQQDCTLELHLRSMRDADHNLVQFLLTQQSSAVRVHMGQAVTVVALDASDDALHHFYIFEHVHRMQQQLKMFTNPGGFYILAIEAFAGEEQKSLQHFMEVVWRQLGHNRIYYVQLAGERVLLYNPFTQSVVPAEDEHSFERIYSNLYGYPLRAYIFDSVYSALFGDGDTERVTRVTGPDAIAADTVAKHLNFTLNYIWPDDEFFG